ncbi:TonB-like protein [Kordia periserrulae]|uniref:TonB-like protein n=1 Tax=Kordia periserrulae TaxID=701523 RepID=A0A2T6C601_9FLAO|nr:energy transducer TonB [Kordia periserrulae]PTX63715.1 TonB-like protein [Kordia periserrulae]
MSFSLKNLLSLLIFFFSLLISAQTEKSKKDIPESTVIEGCQYEEDVYECSKEKFRRSIFQYLKPSDAILIAKNTTKDTIFVDVMFATDSVGKVDKERSSLKFHETEMKPFKIETSSSPVDFQIELAPISQKQTSYIRNHLFLKIDRKNNIFIPLYDYTPKRIPFSGPEVGVVYPGCEKASSNKERKKCMATNISKFVAENFNDRLGKKLGLDGINRIYVVFKINEEGKVKEIRSRAPHLKLEQEAIRVIKKLPDMQPATIENIPVSVNYALPIVLNVSAKERKKRKRNKW